MSLGQNSSTLNHGASIVRTGYSFNTISLCEGSVKELENILKQKIAPNKEIYENTPVVIDVSQVNFLVDVDYNALCEKCKEYSVYLIGLSGIHTEERANILISRHIPIVNSSKFARIREENFKPKIIEKTVEVKVPYEIKVPYEVKITEPLLVVEHNVRAGELISAPDNSVVIFGNVARTARVIASHNVIIFGDLLGEVYAGSPKNKDTQGYKDAFIYVGGMFQPTLLAICGQYQTADDMEMTSALKEIYNQECRAKITLDGRVLNYRLI